MLFSFCCHLENYMPYTSVPPFQNLEARWGRWRAALLCLWRFRVLDVSNNRQSPAATDGLCVVHACPIWPLKQPSLFVSSSRASGKFHSLWLTKLGRSCMFSLCFLCEAFMRHIRPGIEKPGSILASLIQLADISMERRMFQTLVCQGTNWLIVLSQIITHAAQHLETTLIQPQVKTA